MRREGEEGVLRKMKKMQVTVNRLPGRPKGTLDQLVQKGMKKRGLLISRQLDYLETFGFH